MAKTSIGTAWIQIKPSMEGISDSIKKDFNLVEKESEKSGEKSGKSFSKKWAAAAGAISGITSTIFSKVTSTISDNVSSAIKRVDTLSQFPKVLANFGVPAEAAADAIGRISDRMRGLPTSLDAAASGVKDIFMVTKDLQAAEAMFYSINDAAMVFANGSTEAIDNFIYGYKQAMASGKVSAQDFNQMNNAIPGLMDKVAESMGMNFVQLKEGLSSGAVSMEQFNAALVKLDEEGGAGMEAMAQSAKDATGGIQTSFDVMGSAIQRGITSIIDGIGADNIKAVVEGIGKAFEVVGKIISEIIKSIQESEVLRDALLAFMITLGIMVLTSVVPAFVAWTAAMLANPITWIVLGITALITGIILLVSHIQEVGQWFSDVFGHIGEFVGSIVQAIGDWFNGLFTGIGEGLSNIGEFFRNTFQGIWDFITGVFSGIGGFFQGVWDTIIKIFTSVGTAIGDAVGGAFKTVVNSVLGFIEGFLNGPIDLINGFIDVINGAFGFIGVNLGKIDRINLPRLATGGVVGGIGTGTSDSNLALLSKGEYVIKAATAQKIGYDNLDELNETGRMSGEQINNFTINGYNKNPRELANEISHILALQQRGVY